MASEPPCPDCGHGMEVQHVCERCGRREAIGDVDRPHFTVDLLRTAGDVLGQMEEVREAFMAGAEALAAEQFGPGASVVWDADQCFAKWLSGRTEGTS